MFDGGRCANSGLRIHWSCHQEALIVGCAFFHVLRQGHRHFHLAWLLLAAAFLPLLPALLPAFPGDMFISRQFAVPTFSKVGVAGALLCPLWAHGAVHCPGPCVFKGSVSRAPPPVRGVTLFQALLVLGSSVRPAEGYTGHQKHRQGQ